MLDPTPTLFTRDFIGLCVGVLSMVLVVLVVAICKWSRCLCLKRHATHGNQNQVFPPILQERTLTPDIYLRRHYHRHHQRQ